MSNNATANQTRCNDCTRPATFDVLIPWVRPSTDEVGADWTPLCIQHYPTAESWDTILRHGQRTLGNAQFLLRVTGNNGMPSIEDAVAMLEARE